MEEKFNAFTPNAANHVPLSPVSFLTRAAMVYRESTAVVHGQTRRSWAEVNKRVRMVAAGLVARGIKTGDTVTVLCPNRPEFFELFFAVPMVGGVLCSVNTRLELDTVAYILDHSDSRLVLASSELIPLVSKALTRLDDPPELIEIPTDAPLHQHAPYQDLLTTPAFHGNGLPQDEWQAIALNYTSGTSGRPKGVVYHHRGAYLMAMGTAVGWHVPVQPSYMSVVPMFHCNGWCHPWMLAMIGGKMVFPTAPSPAEMFKTIAAENVTHLGAAPVVLQMLAESEAAPRIPFSPPLQVMTAGAPPAPAILERLGALGMDVMHVYGLTETYGHITQCVPKSDWATLEPAARADLQARQGVAFPMVEPIEVFDRDSGQPVPHDGETQGEIAIRGNTVMKGYYSDPAATAEAFRDGYFWSGDAAVVFEDGYVQIRDRLKDVIISGGENVSSVEVEAVLYRHPDVQCAAVVAQPDAKWGEVPCAFIELREGATADEAQIIAFCREHLAGFKTPKSVIFTEIPKTSTGKIQKFQLRARIRTMKDS